MTCQHLSLHVALPPLADEQGSHVGVALLRGQVQRGDPLLGQDVGVRSVLQQHRGDLHLVLLSGDVERSVSVLIQGEGGGGRRGGRDECHGGHETIGCCVVHRKPQMPNSSLATSLL